ncbi:nucleoside triphosphate pyrophosphohydrolase [Bacillus phage Palmer]|uniref:dUTPase n=2 Tax=Pagevirus TaxID=1921184 RepID=A0A0A0RNX7_9CAUD|nr:nucleoside triphosphate pyrophosphohydrolase [Bacillus phage Pookie]YP_009197519.1 nucleoside triphosphate pyrophosphohydrolase [Bacillus phage Pavlov]YP_009210085.1 nucleoside triphosphate pyrophosphohydrolase [Bacillus phage Palmer]AIW03737.1 dUTPase [Bacillus phage Pookie]AJK28117.1 dUTPase [Bacillus phage Palmer]AKQ07471.1 dUTPase [Bacillus phage Pavlov]
MNLKELFEIQAGLDAEILKNHPIQPGEDRLEKKHAALLVELGEMFNEWRAFKFWSHDKEPRMAVKCPECEGAAARQASDGSYVECGTCDGAGTIDKVLKELVDCLHFVLSIGLEHEFDTKLNMVIEPILFSRSDDGNNIIAQFIELLKVEWELVGRHYKEGLELFIGFCEMLGYTWEQVREAYLIKNQENHYRQMNGY